MSGACSKLRTEECNWPRGGRQHGVIDARGLRKNRFFRQLLHHEGSSGPSQNQGIGAWFSNEGGENRGDPRFPELVWDW